VVPRNDQCVTGGPARVPEGCGTRRAFQFRGKDTRSKDANHSYNPTFSIAKRKESVSEMENFIEVRSTEGRCGK
jgi:hypothetical protein